MKRAVASMLSLVLALPGCAARSRPLMQVAFDASRQTAATGASTVDVWRNFLTRLPAGTRVKVTLKNGQSVRAILMQVTEDAVIVNPRTRVPEPLRTIALTDLAAVDLESQGMSVGKAIGIGVAAGVGAFFTVLLIVIATIED